MSSTDSPARDPSAPATAGRAVGIIATATLLALLYACIVAVFLPGMLLQPEEVRESAILRGVDKSAESLGHAVQICLDMQSKAAQA